jgi:ABC-2 type transport system permease protein
VATGVPLAVAALLAGSSTLAVGLVLGAALGALAYCALFLALSVLTKRPVAVGLVYIMLWENVLVGFVDGAKVFSVREHATTLADTVGSSALLTSSVSMPTAMVMSVLFILVGTIGATQRLRSFALTGEAN